MNLQTAKKLLRPLIYICIAACVVSILSTGTTFAMYCTLASFATLAVFLVVYFGYCKCPYCGKRIGRVVLNATHCPHCRRDLVSGKRKKGSGGKHTKH